MAAEADFIFMVVEVVGNGLNCIDVEELGKLELCLETDSDVLMETKD